MTSREIAVSVLLLAVPALTYAIVHRQTLTKRDQQTRRARVERDRWSALMSETGAQNTGLTAGARFPSLPYANSSVPETAIAAGGNATVIMVYSLNVDSNCDDLRQFRQAVEKSPRSRVLIITEEPESVVRHASQIIQHPRIGYVSLQKGSFDRLHQVGQALVYKLDATGTIRERRTYDSAIRLPALISTLSG